MPSEEWKKIAEFYSDLGAVVTGIVALYLALKANRVALASVRATYRVVHMERLLSRLEPIGDEVEKLRSIINTAFDGGAQSDWSKESLQVVTRIRSEVATTLRSLSVFHQGPERLVELWKAVESDSEIDDAIGAKSKLKLDDLVARKAAVIARLDAFRSSLRAIAEGELDSSHSNCPGLIRCGWSRLSRRFGKNAA